MATIDNPVPIEEPVAVSNLEDIPIILEESLRSGPVAVSQNPNSPYGTYEDGPVIPDILNSGSETSLGTIPKVEVVAQRLGRATGDDWRVRLRLGPQSEVLYAGADPGILSPLIETDGVIFPYTPTVQVNHRANYAKTDLVHSNYPAYFYSGSEISDIQINAKFTAQSTSEADYLQAVMHFFKCTTKMFYGQDGVKNGTPPPLVYLSGFGPDQFNEHSCVVNSFNYTLPDGVNYIRTSPGGSITSAVARPKLVGYQTPLQRLFSIGTTKGAEQTYMGANTNLGNEESSYVPTVIELSLTLIPIVNRYKQSNEFSLEKYASGAGLRRGIW